MFDFKNNTLESITYVLFILFCLFTGLIIIIMTVSFFSLQDLNSKYENGTISTEQYCSNYKTSTNPPAVCYDQFKVEKVGEKNVCNLVGKVTTCRREAVLEPESIN